jgi:hypothetical protein
VILRQPDLAETLVQLAKHGHDGFYAGPVGQALVEGVRAAGGIWTLRTWRLTGSSSVRRSSAAIGAGAWSARRRRPPAVSRWCRC